MKKIYLILMLVISSYGYSLNYGIGTDSCGVFLDEMENKTEISGYFIVFALGWIEATNFLSKGNVYSGANNKQFTPGESVLRRTLIKYCDNNLSSQFGHAVALSTFFALNLFTISNSR